MNKICSSDNLLNICGESTDILAVYDLNIRLGDNPEFISQKFFIVPKLTETSIFGIYFVTENAITLNGETRRLTYKIEGKTFSFIAETGTSEYDYSNVIQKLNATVASGKKIE